MFKCEQCSKTTKPYEKATKKITQTRKRDYFNEKEQLIGSGFEIVKEITVCVDCVNTEASQ